MLLEVKNIVKSYGPESVLSGIHFQLDLNQTLSILGKSGCGKTTLLKIIAGLISPDEGELTLAGKSLAPITPAKRNIVYLSQEALLFPHLSVFENIAFGLRIRKVAQASIQQQVALLAGQLGIADQLQKRPNQLSGGQKQRVSFGRALIIKPTILLLDEPFGSLDTQTRADMQTLYRQISHDQSISSIFVTHDLKEALLMGDRMALMKEGTLQTYPDKISFIADSDTGVRHEMAFWQSLSS